MNEAEVIRQAIEHEAVAAAERPLPRSLGAFNEFKAAALARRKLGLTGEPYKWNREELYAEREDRYFRKDK